MPNASIILAVLQPTSRSSRDQAILDSPDLHLDGFLGPGHVSMVIGTRPYRFIAEHYRRPITVAGFEPLDVLQSCGWCCGRLPKAAAKWRTSTADRAEDGNAQALSAISKCSSTRIFRMARAGIDRSFGRSDTRTFRRYAPSAIPVANLKIADPNPASAGSAQRRDQPQQCKVFGSACRRKRRSDR